MAQNHDRPIRNETKITNYFKISNEKYRLCYSPKGSQSKLSIQLNYKISSLIPHLRKIIDLNKYKTIKIYVNKDFYEENEIPEFIGALDSSGYTLMHSDLSKDSLSSTEGEYVFICLFERNIGSTI